MIKILDRARRLRELLTRKTDVLGLPATDRLLVLRRKSQAGYDYELIAPCSITDRSPESSPLSNNGRFSPYRVVYTVQGVSRLTYPERTGLVGADIDYLLDPQKVDGRWFGGTPLRVEAYEESPTSWTLTLVEKPAEQNIYRDRPDSDWS